MVNNDHSGRQVLTKASVALTQIVFKKRA